MKLFYTITAYFSSHIDKAIQFKSNLFFNKNEINPMKAHY